MKKANKMAAPNKPGNATLNDGKNVVYVNLDSIVQSSTNEGGNYVVLNTLLGESSSIHSTNNSAVYDLPLSEIVQPLPITLHESKIQSICEVLRSQNPDEVPPIDVIWVKGKQGGNYYFAFGCSQRLEAHCRLGLRTIKSKLILSTIQELRNYLGASTPDLK